MPRKDTLKLLITDLLLALSSVMVLKALLFTVAYVPSESMNNTFLPGDVLLVWKPPFGWRTPRTPLQLPYFEKAYISRVWLPWVGEVKLTLPSYELWRGYDEPRPGQVLVFNNPHEDHPLDMNTVFLKRCLAVGEDDISYIQGVPHRNGVPVQLPKGVQFMKRYIVNGRMHTVERLMENSDDLYEPRRIAGDPSRLEVTASPRGLELLEERGITVESAAPVPPPLPPEQRQRCYEYGDKVPLAYLLGGTLDDMPAYHVPSAGEEIEVNFETMQRYLMLIKRFEGHKSVTYDIEKNELRIDGEVRTSYTFRYTYIWVGGDNFSHSSDSRHWGPVPRYLLIGKPVARLCSKLDHSWYLPFSLLTLRMRWTRYPRLLF